MNFTGTIYRIGETQVISEKFKKREIVIRTEDKYPQLIGCQFTQEKCFDADHLDVGQVVEVDINLRGREWTNPKTNEVKVFNTIEIWKIKPQVVDMEQATTNGIPRQVLEDEAPNDIDLPF